MDETTSSEHGSILRLVEALNELPDVNAELEAGQPTAVHGTHADARLNVSVAGKPLAYRVEARNEVYPRDARQWVWQLRERAAARPEGQGEPGLPLLLAKSISPGAKTLLRNERVGYYDSGGSLYLPAPGAYVYIDKAPPKAAEKSLRSLYSPRRAQVLHVLLSRHESWFGVTELSRAAAVSPATASQVLSGLERFDWLDSRGQGPSKERRLREPGALLDTWATQLPARAAQSTRRYYVPGVKADALAQRVGYAFAAHGAGYAITSEAAAQRYAPFLSQVSYVQLRVVTGPRADAALAELNARAVHEGSNVSTIEVNSAGDMLCREHRDGLWLASPIQVYLDLLRGEGRSKEMAAHLRGERLGF